MKTKQQKFRLGIVADLTPNGSIHQQTFIRAVNAAAAQLDFASNNIELIWENDRAIEPGGKAASKILVKKKVDCVMGHFASGAAKGALPQYEKKNIPLLLPAATADALTTSFHSALRICAKDSELALFIISELKKRKISAVYIEHDNSLHGQSLAGDLVTRISREKSFSIHRNIQDAEQVIFTGTYRNSIDFALRLQHAPGKVKNIFFTDDLVHDGLAGAIGKSGLKIFVFGADDRAGNADAAACTRQYEKQWKTRPNTYYLETYAAMQVAFQLFGKVTKNGTNDLLEAAYKYKWDTVLGSFRFTPEGESRIKRYALWVLRKNGLKKETIKPQSV
jgi:ABC-type branched-subunit amino acid transport system substrate-binding protein